MKVLFIGDVVAQVGCDFLRHRLAEFKRDHEVDIVIANGENSADSNGVTPYSADQLTTSGVDVITSGNHIFKRYEILEYIDNTPHLIRPANFTDEANGSGVYIYDGGSYRLAVISLMGTSFMAPIRCPFETMDKLLSEIDCKNIIVDFHAEATGEKRALGFYLDSKVSAVVGTHSHVQTADEQILPQGTGYITDVGMTGPTQSVLGVKPDCVIKRLKTQMPVRFEIETGDCHMDCVLIELENKTGKCVNIERFHLV